MENNEIIKTCQEFLEESDATYGKEILRQVDTLASIDDVFSTDVLRDFKRKKRRNLQYSKLGVVINAVTAPFVNSPFHINLDEDANGIQDLVDDFENALDTKSVSRQAFQRGASCGCGYAVIGIDENDRPYLEFIENQSAVAVDPYATKPSLEDAEQGATVQIISNAKAKRMFPEADLTNNSGISFAHLSRWQTGEHSTQMIVYYYKDESGSVHQATIVGNYVKDVDLKISIIPIIRFAGFQQYKRGAHPTRIGLGDKLKDLQLAEAIAFSGLVERSNRTMKSRVAMSDKAMQGDVVLQGIRSCENDESIVLPYHLEGGAPIVLEEKFETGDLAGIIDASRKLEEDTSGVLLSGINPTEKTATETKYQQLNQLNNNAELYLNAEFASRHIAKVVLEIICGQVPKFTLQGGVGYVESSLLNERLIADVSALMQANQPVLAYQACRNSKASQADEIAQSIKANFPDTIFPSDELDVWQELAKAKEIGNQAIEEAYNAMQNQAEIEAENRELNMQLLDSKQNLAEQAREFNIKTQLQVMEMQQKNGLDTAKLEADVQKEAQKAVVEAEKAETERMKAVLESEAPKAPSSVTISNTEVNGGLPIETAV